MFCKNCGSSIDDNAAVCPHCGVVVNSEKLAPASNQTNTLAIVGFILSFFIPLAGLICSIIGYKNAPQFAGKGKGLALAGIIISVAWFVIAIILYVTVFATLGAMLS